MGERVHFWSDIPNDFRASSRRDAELHSETDGTSTQVTSIEKLKSVFRAMLNFKATLDLVDFHTHGFPGGICLGADNLYYDNVEVQLAKQNFETLFSKNASIIFTGCNVGESYTGEYFLVRVGEILLKTSGGKVMGSTGAGLADPLFTGDVFHPTGTWVSAEVGVGGGVKLVNNSYLIPEKVRSRIKDCDTKLATTPRSVKNAPQLSNASSHIGNAKTWVPPGNSTPSFSAMFYACYFIEQAQSSLELAKIIEESTNPRGPKY